MSQDTTSKGRVIGVQYQKSLYEVLRRASSLPDDKIWVCVGYNDCVVGDTTSGFEIAVTSKELFELQLDRNFWHRGTTYIPTIDPIDTNKNACAALNNIFTGLLTQNGIKTLDIQDALRDAHNMWMLSLDSMVQRYCTPNSRSGELVAHPAMSEVMQTVREQLMTIEKEGDGYVTTTVPSPDILTALLYGAQKASEFRQHARRMVQIPDELDAILACKSPLLKIIGT